VIGLSLLRRLDPAVIAGKPANQFSVLAGELEADRIARFILMRGTAREYDQKRYD
jgi:hypothetical protein